MKDGKFVVLSNKIKPHKFRKYDILVKSIMKLIVQICYLQFYKLI